MEGFGPKRELFHAVSLWLPDVCVPSDRQAPLEEYCSNPV